MRLRPTELSDLDAVTELIHRCSKQFILPNFSEEGVREYMSSHSREKMKERLEQFSYQVLEDDSGKIIGVVGMQRPSHLYHLHVAPEFHSKGIGRKLWEAAKNITLKTEQPTKFTVNSSTYAVTFYEKLGFVSAGAKTKNGVTYVPMEMKI